MDKIGAYEAKTHLPRLLDRVAAGEQITITRHGVPVAVLQPVQNDKHVDAAAVIQKLRQFRKKRKLNGLSVKDMIVKGRK